MRRDTQARTIPERTDNECQHIAGIDMERATRIVTGFD
jgi:hypothetical protein